MSRRKRVRKCGGAEAWDASAPQDLASSFWSEANKKSHKVYSTGTVGTQVRFKKYDIRRYLKSEAFWLLVVCLAAGLTIFLHNEPSQGPEIRKEPARMLFVGDVMLARNVEALMDTYGTYYPFKGLRDMLESYEAVIGNFEASIPERHIRTPHLGFIFSVTADTAPALFRVGFTHLTLANNHTYDYGEKAYLHTREVLASAGIAVGGNPRTLTSGEVLYHTVDGVRVAIIPINATLGAPPLEQSTKMLNEAAQTSDVQIVSVHWGDEYKLVANESQRALARALIDAGADAIIGHHPHVVQNIEEYRGAPIFYSLGNYIFDQYWNTDVQEGLTVAVSFTEDKMRFTLVPITSVDAKSSPRPMNRVERLQFLDTLASRSEPALADSITEGNITELFIRRMEDTLVHS